jgi:hypothetical protein
VPREPVGVGEARCTSKSVLWCALSGLAIAAGVWWFLARGCAAAGENRIKRPTRLATTLCARACWRSCLVAPVLAAHICPSCGANLCRQPDGRCGLTALAIAVFASWKPGVFCRAPTCSAEDCCAKPTRQAFSHHIARIEPGRTASPD